MEIKLGKKAKCSFTGFEGIVTARVEYVTGCIQFLVETKTCERWIDESRLVNIVVKRKSEDILREKKRKKRKYVRRYGGFRTHPQSNFGDV